jgi:hypothetical protein
MIERIALMATITIDNTVASRLQTVDFAYSDASAAAQFEEATSDHDSSLITDALSGLVIRELGYEYPLWLYGGARETIR